MNLDDIRINFRNGSVQHRMLALLAKHDHSAAELRQGAGATIRLFRVTEILNQFREWKLITPMSGGYWAITTEGLNASVLLGPVHDTSIVKRSNADKRAEVFQREDYVPSELGFTCFRPGAYDAFLLPSRIGKELHYPNGRMTHIPTTEQTTKGQSA